MGGYGSRFSYWLANNKPEPYNSMGNGAAMRVSAVGWICDSLEDTLEFAERVTKCTHNHPDGVRGAKAVAAVIWNLRHGANRADIKEVLIYDYQIDAITTLEKLRPTYSYNELCISSVQVAALAYLESNNWGDAVRKAISMGGDADTLGAIAGSIAIADPTYQIPEKYYKQALSKMDQQQREVCDLFQKYIESNTTIWE